MTKKEEDRERLVLKTAGVLEQGMKTEFWQYLKDYFLVRTISLKNELVKIDLSKEFSKAAKTQGEIKAFYSISNRINNVIKDAEMIKRKQTNKKEK